MRKVNRIEIELVTRPVEPSLYHIMKTGVISPLDIHTIGYSDLLPMPFPQTRVAKSV